MLNSKQQVLNLLKTRKIDPTPYSWAYVDYCGDLWLSNKKPEIIDNRVDPWIKPLMWNVVGWEDWNWRREQFDLKDVGVIFDLNRPFHKIVWIGDGECLEGESPSHGFGRWANDGKILAERNRKLRSGCEPRKNPFPL